MKRQKGFTLIELLIVIVIIGILAAIVVGLVGTSAQRKARDAKKAAAAHELQNGLELFFTDQNPNAYPADPAAGGGAGITPGYLKNMPDMTGIAYAQTNGGACYTIDVAYEAKPAEQLLCKQ